MARLAAAILTLLLLTTSARIVLAALPAPWEARPSQEHVADLDSTVRHGGKASGTLRSTVAEPEQRGQLSQRFRAAPFHGKRIKVTAWLKTSGEKSTTQFLVQLNAEERLVALHQVEVKGNADWKAHHIIVDVPETTVVIRLSLRLQGAGQAWLDDVAVETVNQEAALTNTLIAEDQPFNAEALPAIKDLQARAPAKPSNLDFEN